MKPVAVVRGAGDLATAAGRRLHLCGFAVVHLEAAEPAVIRRAVAFASAVEEGAVTVEGVTARLAADAGGARAVIARNEVAVLVDPDMDSLPALNPAVLVDATMRKGRRAPGVPTRLALAPCVVGLGPGFEAGREVHFVVETARGHDLGRVLSEGSAQPYTGIPGTIAGEGVRRVLRAPRDGRFRAERAISDLVEAGDILARVDGVPVTTAISGVVRGLLAGGRIVREGQKVGDVDPRSDPRLCFTISDKANAVAGGVLEAVFRCRK